MGTTLGGVRFRKWRLLVGRSQASVAAELGVTANFIWRIEAGLRRPGGDLAARMSAMTKGVVGVADWYPGTKRKAA
jgi:transcriptional regulator with XRE-family HTH domain